MSAIAGLIAEFLYSLFVDVLLVWTGEVLRFGFSMGRRKPCFRFWRTGTDPGGRESLNASLLLGLVFWIAVLVGVTVWSAGS
jgi:hypothetical protein